MNHNQKLGGKLVISNRFKNNRDTELTNNSNVKIFKGKHENNERKDMKMEYVKILGQTLLKRR